MHCEPFLCATVPCVESLESWRQCINVNNEKVNNLFNIMCFRCSGFFLEVILNSTLALRQTVFFLKFFGLC